MDRAQLDRLMQSETEVAVSLYRLGVRRAVVIETGVTRHARHGRPAPEDAVKVKWLDSLGGWRAGSAEVVNSRNVISTWAAHTAALATKDN